MKLLREAQGLGYAVAMNALNNRSLVPSFKNKVPLSFILFCFFSLLLFFVKIPAFQFCLTYLTFYFCDILLALISLVQKACD